MAIAYQHTHKHIAQVWTSRTVSISTAAATLIVTSAGTLGLSIFNVGVSTLAWGDSNITASTGGLLYYSMQKEWMGLADTFAFYLRADSVAGVVLINEYK